MTKNKTLVQKAIWYNHANTLVGEVLGTLELTPTHLKFTSNDDESNFNIAIEKIHSLSIQPSALVFHVYRHELPNKVESEALNFEQQNDPIAGNSITPATKRYVLQFTKDIDDPMLGHTQVPIVPITSGIGPGGLAAFIARKSYYKEVGLDDWKNALMSQGVRVSNWTLNYFTYVSLILLVVVFLLVIFAAARP